MRTQLKISDGSHINIVSPPASDERRFEVTLVEPHHGSIITWREGRFFYDLAEHPCRAYYIQSGVVELRRTKSGLPNYVGAGTTIGLDSLLYNLPSTEAAVARTRCEVIEVRVPCDDNHQHSLFLENALLEIRSQNIERDEFIDDFISAKSRAAKICVALKNIAVAVYAGNHNVSTGRPVFPFEVTWWKCQQEIGDNHQMCTVKVREALNLLRRWQVIDNTWHALGYRGQTQIVLLPNCVQAIDSLMKSMLS